MKKFIVIFLILLLATSVFYSVSSNQNLQDKENQVIIYQITNNSIKQILSSYSQKSIESDFDFYSKYEPNNIDGFDFIIISTENLKDSITTSTSLLSDGGFPFDNHRLIRTFSIPGDGV